MERGYRTVQRGVEDEELRRDDSEQENRLNERAERRAISSILRSAPGGLLGCRRRPSRAGGRSDRSVERCPGRKRVG